MSNQIKISIYIVFLVALFAVGFWAAKFLFMPDVASRTISSVIIFGKVSQIQGRTVTVTDNQEQVPVVIPESASISVLAAPVVSGNSVDLQNYQNQSDFRKIKAGDDITINATFDTSGVLVGDSVVILSSLFIQ